MAYLDELYAEKKRYEVLRTKVNDAASKIGEAVNKLDTPITNLENSFKIDDFSSGTQKLKKIKNELEYAENSLSGGVISAIDSEISHLEDLIEEEEAKEDEEEEETPVTQNGVSGG